MRFKNPILPYLLLLGGSLIIIGFLPYLFTQFKLLNFDFYKTGPIGDTIGGIMGPFIGIIGAILTFAAFWVQYQANQEQKRQFNEQITEQKRQFDIQLSEQKTQGEEDNRRYQAQQAEQSKSWAIERFEKTFFELLKVQRDIASEIKIRKKQEGVQTFISFYYEFRFIYLYIREQLLIEQVWPIEEIRSVNYHKDEEILRIAFIVFFMGVGPNSNPLLLYAIKKEGCDNINNKLIESINTLTDSIHNFPQQLECRYLDENGREQKMTYTAYYRPAQGHQGKLSHYFRHLYQVIKFVDGADPKIFTDSMKYEYVRFIRAQLSIYEQAMLYFHGFSPFGKNWMARKFLIKYKLIRNAPIKMFAFSITPDIRFSEDIKLFWEKPENFFTTYASI